MYYFHPDPGVVYRCPAPVSYSRLCQHAHHLRGFFYPHPTHRQVGPTFRCYYHTSIALQAECIASKTSTVDICTVRRLINLWTSSLQYCRCSGQNQFAAKKHQFKYLRHRCRIPDTPPSHRPTLRYSMIGPSGLPLHSFIPKCRKY